MSRCRHFWLTPRCAAFAFVLAGCSAAALAEEIYRSVGPDGVVGFSDVVTEHAVPVTVEVHRPSMTDAARTAARAAELERAAEQLAAARLQRESSAREAAAHVATPRAAPKHSDGQAVTVAPCWGGHWPGRCGRYWTRPWERHGHWDGRGPWQPSDEERPTFAPPAFAPPAFGPPRQRDSQMRDQEPFRKAFGAAG